MQDLEFVLDGWDGYHQSIVDAIRDLNAEQLAFRGAPDMRSVGEVAWHIADGRVDWFNRMGVPEADELSKVEKGDLVSWLDRTWQMVAKVLKAWSIEDLKVTFEQPYQGKVFAVSRQWVIWRIMCHDIHHGGQLSELLAMQGIEPLNLTLLGGHMTEPPEVKG